MIDVKHLEGNIITVTASGTLSTHRRYEVVLQRSATEMRCSATPR